MKVESHERRERPSWFREEMYGKREMLRNKRNMVMGLVDMVKGLHSLFYLSALASSLAMQNYVTGMLI